jgi:hypothetical protein
MCTGAHGSKVDDRPQQLTGDSCIEAGHLAQQGPCGWQYHPIGWHTQPSTKEARLLDDEYEDDRAEAKLAIPPSMYRKFVTVICMEGSRRSSDLQGTSVTQA